mmetsp:Transcript_107845/g.292392  ORF Transcript_107845/g.292392 Transcript_107845/m.292392 type:complete len:201 (-) Transcript_107845:515-1117(-)
MTIVESGAAGAGALLPPPGWAARAPGAPAAPAGAGAGASPAALAAARWRPSNAAKSTTGQTNTGRRLCTATESASSTPVLPYSSRTRPRIFSHCSATSAGALAPSTTDSAPAPSVYARCPFRRCSHSHHSLRADTGTQAAPSAAWAFATCAAAVGASILFSATTIGKRTRRKQATMRCNCASPQDATSAAMPARLKPAAS